ncbi:MAG: 3-oxoacid CoA-transferase subunit B [Pseudomonadota bacterium]
MNLKPADIARRVAQDIPGGSYVNLGIGMPMLVVDWIAEDREIVIHSDNGILGMGPAPDHGRIDMDIIDVAKAPVTMSPGGAYFDHVDSYAMIRGGHIDIAIMGAYQVSSCGDIANWLIPGPKPPAVGGAMDLVAGVNQVWVMLSSLLDKQGQPKLMERCTLPASGLACVDRIYADVAVIDVTDNGLLVTDILHGLTQGELRSITAAPLEFSDGCRVLRPPEPLADPRAATVKSQ